MRTAILALLALFLVLPARAEENQVNIYNWTDYIGHDTIARFQAQTGITVIYDTFDNDAAVDKKIATGSSGYDLVSTSTSYFRRQIKLGLYETLDRSLLPNWKNLDKRAIEIEAEADPGNAHAVPYLNGTDGFIYNVAMIKARMKDAPVDSLDLIFKPEIAAKFADCGITFLTNPEDVIQLALKYLGRDPNTSKLDDYLAAQNLLLAVRPYVQNLDSSEYLDRLGRGELCIAMAWSADYRIAQSRIAQGKRIDLAFTVPKEGAVRWYDGFLIPKGAPHPKAAHAFLNYLLDAHVIADITNDIFYANDNAASLPFVKPEILADPAIYPSAAIEQRLFEALEVSPETERIRTRVWSRVTVGQ
jgi:putrescine transport system substrate-binding protein